MQVKYRLERDICDGHATGAIKVQANERYLMVFKWMNLECMLEREICNSRATSAIKAQARERDI